MTTYIKIDSKEEYVQFKKEAQRASLTPEVQIDEEDRLVYSLSPEHFQELIVSVYHIDGVWDIDFYDALDWVETTSLNEWLGVRERKEPRPDRCEYDKLKETCPNT